MRAGCKFHVQFSSGEAGSLSPRPGWLVLLWAAKLLIIQNLAPISHQHLHQNQPKPKAKSPRSLCR